MIIIDKNSDSFIAKKYCGGKGLNLYILGRAGLPVPDFKVLTPHSFNHFTKISGLDIKIADILGMEISEEDKAKQIEKLIIQTPIDEKLRKFLLELKTSFGEKILAVRSSALDEDSGAHSYAGMLESHLYISEEDKFLEAIKKCWASAFGHRCLTYRRENNLKNENIQISLVVQEMIDPDKSGVMFTANPVTTSGDEMLINSVYGVGEGLVSGLLDADTFALNKENGALNNKEIVKKEKKLIADHKNQAPKEACVENYLMEVSSLNDSEIEQLYVHGMKIEDLYHFPQDIEWAIKDGNVYILQARPITTDVTSSKGQLYMWDNSNIVESYGGITRPLTFGFAHYVYHQVYVQFCEVLMVPHKHIKEMDFFLKNMLGHFNGRVYYNLLNWYKLTSILPGYKYNRAFMETMMGTNEALQNEIADRVRPPSFQNTTGAKVRKILTGMKFFYFHLNAQSVVDNFLDYFYKTYDKYKQIDFEAMPADAIYLKYHDLEKEMLWRWHAPIINDFLCMVHFGIFKKLTEKWLSNLGPNFHNDLLAGNGNLESAMPTKELIRIAGIVEKNKELREFLFENDNDILIELLRQSTFQNFYKTVTDYIDRYGFRCMSEMKLEQKDLYQDPSLFFIFLKNIINSGQTDLHEFEKREKAIRRNAEEMLSKNITGLKRLIYKWSLKHARKAVMNRENTRFCRTRVYGIVRRMFYAIGSDYTKRNIIDNREDIFFITLSELKAGLEGTMPTRDLRALINIRKKEFNEYENSEDPKSRFHTRGPVYWHNNIFEEPAPIELGDLKENQMRGIGCCPGVIRGVIKVINGPEDDLVLNGEIVVAKRTDPGWIPLYPSISALLVERGGLLSHSAIVAREMGLPTIVSVKDLTKRLKSGMLVEINGETGLIEILSE